MAAVIGLIVAVLVYVLLTRAVHEPEPEVAEKVTMLVAETDIGEFQTITHEMVSATPVDPAAAPPGYLSEVTEAVGKLAQRRISYGEAITRADVAARSAARGLTFVIPEGMRAVTVALDSVSGVAGFALPGDRVDVLTTSTVDGREYTRTILQDVVLLAIGPATTRPQPATARPSVTDEQADATVAVSGAEGAGEAAPRAEEVQNATLAVWPDEAQSLILAAATGSIHLMLRPTGDASITPLPPQSDWEIMGLEAPPEVEEEAPEPEPEQPPHPLMTADYPPPWVSEQPPPPRAEPVEPVAVAEEPRTVEVVRGKEREIVPVR